MPKYEVRVEYRNVYETVIEADNESEAIEFAKEDAADDFFFGDCDIDVYCDEIIK